MAERGTIAGEALKYAGAGYVYGGTAAHPGDWDCSSFVSYVLGHDLRMKLPGGGSFGDPGFPPNSHGPVVTSYASWAGAARVRRPGPGVLCCWVGEGVNGHIGIAIDGQRMISALDSADGTKVTRIDAVSKPGVPLVFRQVKGAAGGAAAGPGDAVPKGAAAGAVAGLLLVGASVGALFLAAVAVGQVGGLAVAAAVGTVGAGSRSRAEPG